ncbi:MAG TPA: hypothetical protein VF656_07185 [Pyrinomonadaceae bacterium]|jgi:hypothetical protein
MKATSAMLLVLLISAGSLAQTKRVETFQFEKKAGSHLALVVFRTRRFTRAGHRSTGVVRGQTMVDGRPAIGTDGNIPGVEIVSMRFYLDGKEIKIPRRLYADCFDPHFGDDDVTLEFEREFRSVVVTMSGSDGAGGYEAIWRLSRDGQHQRSIVPGG